MTIGDIRKLAATERFNDQCARERQRVTTLCDAIDALLAVVDALPRCIVSGCGTVATRRANVSGAHACDQHADPEHTADLPYADALRALLAGGAR